MSEWQPIETAPKDGGEVLLWQEGWGVIRGWYSGDDKTWYGPGAHDSEPCRPTHWMPLPRPPK